MFDEYIVRSSASIIEETSGKGLFTLEGKYHKMPKEPSKVINHSLIDCLDSSFRLEADRSGLAEFLLLFLELLTFLSFPSICHCEDFKGEAVLKNFDW